MRNFVIIFFAFFANSLITSTQKTPSGNPADFKVKTCLHSVSYLGIWREQTPLSVDEFLVKAKELGYEGVMLVAKRPHVSPHDYDMAARARLKAKIDSLGLTLEQQRESILKMKPFIINTIVADYVTHPRFTYVNNLTNYQAEQPVMRAVPVGQGIIDYKNWMNTLKEIGYQGWVVYEMCEVLDGGGSIENLDKTAKIFLDYMKQF